MRLEPVFLAQRFQALLQSEQPDQIGGGRRLEERRDRRRIGGRHGERVAVVFHPDVENRVRRGIVLAPRAFGDLLSRLRGDDRAHQWIQCQRQRKAEPPRRGKGNEDAPCRVLHDPRRHAFVRDADPLRTAGIDRAAREHEVERRRRSGEPRQPFHSAPAGHDAEHHFGQPEPCPGLVDHDPVTAGERQLEPAAQAKAADERHRRIFHCGEALEGVPAALHDRERGGLVADRLELVDVGAGDEPARLARHDDEAARRVAVELVERLVELREHRRAERVGGRAGAVERQPRDAVGIAGESPVLHREFAFSMLSGYSQPGQTLSTSVAPPRPPPMQIAAIPRRPPVRFSTFSTWRTIRAPEAPTG